MSFPPDYSLITYLVYQGIAIVTHCKSDREQRKCKFAHCTKKATIHQVTTMIATSKNVLFPGHNYLLITVTDDLIL